MYPTDETPLSALIGTADDPLVDAALARRKQTSVVRFEPFRLPKVACTVIVVEEGEPVREVA